MQTKQETSVHELTSFVDELEASYNARLVAMQREYHSRMQTLLRNYKTESQTFDSVVLQQHDEIARLRSKLRTFKLLYKREKVEHNITKDQLRYKTAE